MTKQTTYTNSEMVIRDDLTDWLKKYTQETVKEAEDVVAKFALIVQAESARDAPVDTGNLKNSMNAQEQTPLKWTVSDETEYGIFQELGTSRGVTANHFLGGAAERNADKFFNAVLEALKK